jgi:hypothetical protein
MQREKEMLMIDVPLYDCGGTAQDGCLFQEGSAARRTIAPIQTDHPFGSWHAIGFRLRFECVQRVGPSCGDRLGQKYIQSRRAQ